MMTSRSFYRVAELRLKVAQFLLEHGHGTESKYLGGYSIECAMKSLILDACPPAGLAAMLKKITSGQSMHNYEVLAAILNDQGHPLPPAIRTSFRRWNWSTSLRYSTVRTPHGEVAGFLKLAGRLTVWVKGELSW